MIIYCSYLEFDTITAIGIDLIMLEVYSWLQEFNHKFVVKGVK